MARPIDEKIVAMKMDNTDFVNKAAQTTGIFGKLNDTLNKIPGVNLGKTTQELGNIQNAAGRVDMTGLASNIETVASRFSTLGVTATTALVNISNRAVDAGINLARSLTIAPIMDGFREYELKMGSIQTILANTQRHGTKLEDVKKAFNELNAYADQTIYSFADMTKNIGLFTNAGLKLEESTSMIKGFSNAAASSGANAENAARAAYQLSQGLSSGYLMQLDWMSLTNAGMGNDNMKRDLIALGQAMGTLNVDTETAIKDWKALLSDEKWLTSDVMSAYLQAMAGDLDKATLKTIGLSDAQADMLLTNAKLGEESATKVRTFTQMLSTIREGIGSGWAESSEIVFGDFEEATKRWSALGEVIGGFFQKSTHARNTFLKVLADIGVFKGLFALFTNSGIVVLKIIEAIGSGIGAAFSGMGKFIGEIAKGFKMTVKNLIPGKKILESIANISEGIFSIIGFIIKAAISLGAVLLKLIPFNLFGNIINGALTFLGYIAETTSGFVDFIEAGIKASGILDGVKRMFKAIDSWSSGVVDDIQAFGGLLHDIWEIVAYQDWSNVGPWARNVIMQRLLGPIEALINFRNAMSEVWNIVANGNFTGVGPWGENSKIVDKLFDIRENLLEFTSAVQQAWDVITTGDFTKGPWEGNSKVIGALLTIRDAMKSIGDSVDDAKIAVFGALFTILEKSMTAAGKLGDAILDIIPEAADFKPVKILETLIVKTADAITATEGLRKVFGTAGDAISQTWSVLAKGELIGKGPWDNDDWIVGKLFAIREGCLAVIEYISEIDISLTPVANAFGSFFGVIGDGFNWVKEKISGIGEAIRKMLPDKDQLLAGGFLAVMAVVVGKAMLLANGLLEIFTGWGEIGNGVADVLTGVSRTLNTFALSIAGDALIKIAIAIGILTVSIWGLSKLNGEQAATALYAIIGSLTALVGALAVISKYNLGANIGTAFSLIGLAIALGILALALKGVSDMKWSEVSIGLAGLVGAMAALAAGVVIMSKFGGGKLGATAIQMIGIAIAVKILASSLDEIAKLDGDQLTKGLLTLGAILIELGIFMRLAGKGGFGVFAGLGMLAIGGAITNITEAIKEIIKLKPADVKRGLQTMGWILGMVGLFTVLTSDLGILSAGAGLLLMAGAITALIIPITILGNMDVKKLSIGMGSIAIALFAIAGASKLMGGSGILAGVGIGVIAASMMLLMIPMATFAAMSWESIAKGIVGVAGAILLIGGAAALIGMFAPEIAAFGVSIGMVSLAMLLGAVAISLFGVGLMSLATLTSGAVVTIVATLGTLIAGLFSLIPSIAEFIMQLTLKIIQVFAEFGPPIARAFGDLVLSMLTVANEYTPQFIQKGTDLVTNFIDGIANSISAIIQSANNLVLSFIIGMSDTLRENGDIMVAATTELMGEILLVVVKAGADMVEALFGWIPGVEGAAKDIGKSAEKYIRDNFKADEAAKDKIEEFKKGMEAKKKEVEKSGEDTAKAAKSGAGSIDMKPTGTKFMEGFTSGMHTKKLDIETAGTNMATAGKTGASSVSMNSAGADFGQGFANGIRTKEGEVNSASESLASKAAGKIKSFLGIASPSKLAIKFGQFFGDGLRIGMDNRVDAVTNSAARLAQTARDSLNEFIDSFEVEDNELQFKAVIDYTALDVGKFGKLSPLSVQPNMSLTRNLAASVRQSRQIIQPVETKTEKKTDNTAEQAKRPAIIQVVTPDKRELARYLVDDITEFQEFKMATINQF